MADNTYTLISSNVLSTSAASVTFASIPSTYTDLVLRMSVRTDQAGNFTSAGYVRFNSDSASNYSLTELYGDGSVGYPARQSSSTYGWWSYQGFNAAGTTSNTFTHVEMYVPSYTVSQNKPFSSISAGENNATTAILDNVALQWRNTAAVSSIFVGNTANFVSGSSFYLYGIKNS